jgi:phospholipid/cholesterol/gamma-HCH transport system substrate-binding protein
VSGIKAGTITGMTLDENYRAVLTMNVDNSIKLPTDSAAVVASSGLLGDKFIALEPGADEEVLKNGDTIGMTQSPPGLEQLLGQVIFSINKQSGDKPAEGQPAEPAAAPATAPATAVAPAPAEGLSE